MGTTYTIFEELEAWKMARELRKELSELVRKLPVEEKYLLSNQIIRASRSVTANIAEGFGRYHYQENIQFCRQSRGSLFELIDHFSVALDMKYINEEYYKNLRSRVLNAVKILNGYIAYLAKAKKNTNKSE